MSRFDDLPAIAPLPGPLGDDLLLRAIHAGFLGHVYPVQDDGFPEPFIRKAERLGLVRTAVRDDVVHLRTTEAGALYWETRGATFSSFVYGCPDPDGLAYDDGGTAPAP